MLDTKVRDAAEAGDPAWLRQLGRFAPHVAIVLFAFCLLALAGRIMTYPMQHDEQLYVSAAILFDRYPLYSGMGFSHLPNTVLLFSTAFALLGDAQYLLISRCLVFAAWVATVSVLLLFARDYARSMMIGALMIALLVLNPLFLNATGMAATSNFLPIPFALFGLYLLFRIADRSVPSFRLAMTSGLFLALAAGFKANYGVMLAPIVIAILLVPSLSFRDRLLRLALPMLIGGVIGGLPTIFYLLQDPHGFLVHLVDFHRGPQLGYWAANVDPADPKVIAMGDKMLLAHRFWLSGVTMLIVVMLVSLVAIAAIRRSPAFRWQIVLVSSIALLGAITAFLPSPAFAQYFAPPLPFLIVLIGLVYGTLDEPGRRLARPSMAAVFLLTVVTGAPMLLSSVTGALNPWSWTGARVARDGASIAALVHSHAGSARMATLSPLHALEGRLDIYPHFALGPFVHRATPWIDKDDRRYFTYLVAPAEVSSLLRREPPAAILTGIEGAADLPLDNFARLHGFHKIDLVLGSTEDGAKARLYLAP